MIQNQLGEGTSTQEQLFQAEQNLRDRRSLITQNQGELQQAIAEAARLQVELTQREAEGRKIQPGQTVAELAPQAAPLVLSAVLPNREAGFVKVGMGVQVKLDVFPYQNYGVVSGKVTSISPDAKPDEKLGPVYQVKVELDRNYITDEHKRIQFKAGQTASADIVIRRRRIAEMLLDPIR